MQTNFVQAPDLRGKISKSYTFQIMCSSTGGSNATGIKEALFVLVLTDAKVISYVSSGNGILMKRPFLKELFLSFL